MVKRCFQAARADQRYKDINYWGLPDLKCILLLDRGQRCSMRPTLASFQIFSATNLPPSHDCRTWLFSQSCSRIKERNVQERLRCCSGFQLVRPWLECVLDAACVGLLDVWTLPPADSLLQEPARTVAPGSVWNMHFSFSCSPPFVLEADRRTHAELSVQSKNNWLTIIIKKTLWRAHLFTASVFLLHCCYFEPETNLEKLSASRMSHCSATFKATRRRECVGRCNITDTPLATKDASPSHH